MTLAERQLFTAHQRALPRGLWAFVAAVAILFIGIAVVATVGVTPLPQGASHAAATPVPGRGAVWTNAALADPKDPACAAALSRARQTQGLSSRDAIAASTAMLRACDLR